MSSELPALEAMVRLCTFVVGDQRYVVDIMRIHEVINPRPVTALQGHGSSHEEGVIELRGRLVPVYDLRRCLGLPAAPLTPAVKQMIVQLEGNLAAFRVDEMGRVVEVERSLIREADGLDEGTRRLFPGAVMVANRLHLLINLNEFVHPTKTREMGATSR